MISGSTRATWRAAFRIFLIHAVLVAPFLPPCFAQELLPAGSVLLEAESFIDGFLALDARLGRLSEDGKVEAYGQTIAIDVRKGNRGKVYRVKAGKSTKSHRRFPIPVKLAEGLLVHLVPWSGERFLCVSAYGAKFHRDGQAFYVIDADMNRKLGEPGRDGFAGPDCRTLGFLTETCWTDAAKYRMKFGEGEEGKPEIRFEKEILDFTRDEETLKAWTFINAQRRRVDSAALVWDENLVEGCRLHALYCDRNDYHGHFEDPKKPGYTEKGARAGLYSLLGYSETLFKQAVLGQLRTVYHASGAIYPGARRTAWIIEKGVFCWNVGEGSVRNYRPRDARYRKDVICFWPPSGAVNVPNNFSPGGERPMPVRGGETKYLTNLGQAAFAEVRKPEGEGFYDLHLIDERGAYVEGFLTSPMRPVFTGQIKGVHVSKNGDLVSFAPKKFLKPRTKYTAELYEGGFRKKKLIFSWWFKTGSR